MDAKTGGYLRTGLILTYGHQEIALSIDRLTVSKVLKLLAMMADVDLPQRVEVVGIAELRFT